MFDTALNTLRAEISAYQYKVSNATYDMYCLMRQVGMSVPSESQLDEGGEQAWLDFVFSKEQLDLLSERVQSLMEKGITHDPAPFSAYVAHANKPVFPKHEVVA